MCVLFVGGIATAILFCSPGTIPAAYNALIVLTGVKLALLLQDYRLILNQHYMAAWCSVVFLLWPFKRESLRVLLVLFYVWAAALKMNSDWLSGAALMGARPFGMPASLIPAACVYVVVLESVIAPCLLSKRKWLFWLALGQLALFHISSFWVVGFFYPILMFLLLSILSSGPSAIVPPATGSMGQGTRVRCLVSIGALVATFSVFQLPPKVLSREPALSGEGRMFGLHMFDGGIVCAATGVFRSEAGEARAFPINPPLLHSRVACDPLVYFQVAKSYCLPEAGHDHRQTTDFDLRLVSRKAGERTVHVVMDVHGFCNANLRYEWFRHNKWILPSG